MLAIVESAPSRTLASVEVIREEAAFAAMRREWTALLAASRSDCIFLTWEWLHTWWRSLGAGRQLHLLAVREGGELVAVAPFALSPRFACGHPLQALEFLGSGFAGSDYLDIIVRKGSEAAAVSALAGYLSRQPYALKWTNVNEDAVIADLARELGESRWAVAQTKTNVCPYVPLAGLDWDAYMATLGAAHRYDFHRKWRRLERSFAVRWDAEGPEAIGLAIDLHRRRWGRSGQSNAFHTPSLVEFHRAWTPLAADRDWLRIFVLRLGGQPAACLYGFLYGGRFYFYQSGFDPAYAKHSVGLVAMGLAIKDAIGEGATEFDLLHGDESYKRHWAPAQRSLYRWELFPPNRLGRLSRVALGTARGARALCSRLGSGTCLRTSHAAPSLPSCPTSASQQSEGAARPGSTR